MPDSEAPLSQSDEQTNEPVSNEPVSNESASNESASNEPVSTESKPSDPAPSDLVSSEPLPKGYDLNKLSEVFEALAQKGADLLADSDTPIPGVGALSPTISLALRSLFTSSPTEPDQDLVEIKLTEFSFKADQLSPQFSAESLKPARDALDQIKTVAERINGIWKGLRIAEKNADLEEFQFGLIFLQPSKDIPDLDPDSLQTTYTNLHNVLLANQPSMVSIEDKPSYGPLIQNIHDLLESCMSSQTKFLTYDIIDFKQDMETWFKYISDVQTKGVIINIMIQFFRLVTLRNTEGQYNAVNYDKLQKEVHGLCRAFKFEHDRRLKTYAESLLGGALDYPATKLLDEAATLDDSQQYPKLFLMKLDGTEEYMKISLTGFPGNELSVMTNTMGLPNGRVNYTFGFGFVRRNDKGDGTWFLRSSSHPTGTEDPAKWMLCRDDDEGQLSHSIQKVYGLFGRNLVEAKIIPHPSGSCDPLITLAFLDSNRKLVVTSWKLRLRDSGLPLANAFITDPNPRQELLNRLGKTKKILFWINNFTPFVLVLQDARYTRNTEFHTLGNAWLSQQRGCVGLTALSNETADVAFTLKLRVYRVDDSDSKSRDAVEKLVCIDPTKGKLGLDSSQPIHDLFIKVQTSSDRNHVSAVILDADHPHGKMPDRPTDLHLPELETYFNTKKIVQKETGENASDGLKLRYSISGGVRPDASLDILAD